MSLEVAIQENTAAIKMLIAVMQSASAIGTNASAEFAGTSTAQPGTTTSKGARSKKGDTSTATGSTSTDTSVNDGKKVSVKLQPGDPEGTRYFHIEKHRTVAAVKPGEVIPAGIEGMIEIDGEQHASLRAQYAAPVPSSAAAPIGASAAAPASSSPSASTASSPTSAPSPQVASGPIDGPAVKDKCVAVHGLHGNDGLLLVLQKHKAANVPGLIANSEVHAAAAADLDKLASLPKGTAIDALKAALVPAAAVDNSSLFG